MSLFKVPKRPFDKLEQPDPGKPVHEPRRATILLVDDEPHAFFVLSEILKSEYRVFTAASGEAALEVFAREKVDLVITDQRMPGMSGVDLLRRTMEIDPTSIRIVLTAYPDIDMVLEAVNSGRVYAFVIKPWDPAAMRATVRRALEHRDMIGANMRLLEEIQRRNEELERSQRLVGELQKEVVRSEQLVQRADVVGQVAHRLRNKAVALRAIEAIAGHHAELHPDVAQIAALVRETSDDLVHLVDPLEEVAAATAATPGAAAEASALQSLTLTDPNACVSTAVQAFRTMPEGKGRVVVEDYGAVPECELDANRFRQAVLNLLRNAGEATREGGEVRVSTRQVGTEVRIVVSDDGRGIPRARLGRIWQPFYTTRGAMGLGLPITRRIIESTGGTIDCDSDLGRGATFTIRISPRATPGDGTRPFPTA